MTKENKIALGGALAVGVPFLLAGFHFEVTGDDFFLRTIVSTLMLVLGAVFTVGFIKMQIRFFSAKSWPATHGRILSADMTEFGSSEGSTTYGINLKYEYKVNGNRLVGSCISADNPDLSTSSIKKTESRLERYKPGTEVTVYYSKDKHEDAVLRTERGLSLPWLVCTWFLLLTLWPLGIAGLLGYFD